MNKYEKLKESETYYNLAKAFAGESMARNRYTFLHEMAKDQNLYTLADIIKELADNEMHHAKMFYSYIQKSTDSIIENIDIEGSYPFKENDNFINSFILAYENEKDEALDIYPEFARVAEREGFLEIKELFLKIASVEEYHMALLEEMYIQLKDNTVYKKDEAEIWKCSACGYQYESKNAYAKCPLCLEPVGKTYLKLDNYNS